MNLPQVTRYFNTVVFRIYFTFLKAGLRLPLSLFFCLKIFPADVVIVHFPADVGETELLNLPKLRSFNTHVVVTPIKLLSLLLHFCNLAAVLNFQCKYLICRMSDMQPP